MWTIGGFILAGENRSIQRKTCSIVTLSTTSPTWTDLWLKGGLLTVKGLQKTAQDLAQFLGSHRKGHSVVKLTWP